MVARGFNAYQWSIRRRGSLDSDFRAVGLYDGFAFANWSGGIWTFEVFFLPGERLRGAEGSCMLYLRNMQ